MHGDAYDFVTIVEAAVSADGYIVIIESSRNENQLGNCTPPPSASANEGAATEGAF